MTDITQVLCPVDFSDISRHALDSAVAIARQHQAAVTALHVVPPVQTGYPSLGVAAYVPYVYSADDLREFQKATERFVADVGYPVTAVSVEAVAVNEIVKWAAELPADLIVIGTHGRSGFDRLFLGSVTERVLAKAPCPVLTIPPGSPKVVPRAKPLFRNVLCPVDFSPSSRAALTYVEGLAREPGSALTVLHVVERLPSFQLVPAATGTPGDPLMVLKAARQHLHRAIPDALRRAAAVNEVVSEGDAGDEILAAAGTSHCDLIVMGAHAGHGLLGFGSTTNHVIRHATCPVLTLKA